MGDGRMGRQLDLLGMGLSLTVNAASIIALDYGYPDFSK